MHFNASLAAQTALTYLSLFGLKVLGAIILWFVGRWLIRLECGQLFIQ